MNRAQYKHYRDVNWSFNLLFSELVMHINDLSARKPTLKL